MMSLHARPLTEAEQGLLITRIAADMWTSGSANQTDAGAAALDQMLIITLQGAEDRELDRV